MRGKLRNRETCAEQHGITPADAGKTMSTLTESLAYGDHPRGCGENIGSAENGVPNAGSPPRMRGKHRNCRQYAYQHGITPADAGKTL